MRPYFFNLDLLFVAAALSLALVADKTYAENSSTAKASTASSATSISTEVHKILQNKKFEETNTLTDSKLRADDGSLSRFSLKGSFSFFGPTLGDLSAKDQPNPDGTVGSYAQALKGSAMMRYRLSSVSALSAGTGIAIIHPFHGWSRTDVNNPFFSFDRAIRYKKLQLRTSPGLTIATVPEFTRTGEIGGLTWDNSLYSKIADSRLGFTFDTNIAWWVYNRKYRPGSVRRGGDGRALEYTLSVYPGLKYSLSDQMTVYSSYGFQLFNPRERTDKSVLWRRTPSTRLGFSYAFGRDAYISPYLSTYPSEAFSKATTINLSTVFSLL